jgi:Ankyrin repeats (3 copies)
LVDAKANLNPMALFAAAGNRHLNVVQTLLAKGVEVNANTGVTALILASQKALRIWNS